MFHILLHRDFVLNDTAQIFRMKVGAKALKIHCRHETLVTVPEVKKKSVLFTFLFS